MRTSILDDLYLKSDQKVVRLWPDQPHRLVRSYYTPTLICINLMTNSITSWGIKRYAKS